MFKKWNILFGVLFIINFFVAETIDKTYIIKKGDCLWKISKSLFDDPFLWRNIWECNSYIKNPDLIYPNNKLNISSLFGSPIFKEEIRQEENTEKINFLEEAQLKGKEDPKEKEKSIKENPVVIPEEKKYISYISEEEIILDGEIIEVEEKKSLIGLLDIVYISINGDKKENYYIYELGKEIVHPITQQVLGKLIQMKGKLEVIAEKENIIKAKVSNCVRPIKIGDKLKFYSPDEEKIVTSSEEIKEGYIVAIEDPLLLIGNVNIVFIDKGYNTGIKKGDLLTIFREGKKIESLESIKEFPEQIVGTLKILSTQPNTSTGKIIKAQMPVLLGDKIKKE